MPDVGDLERRVSALEERLGMESGLAASRDRDVSQMQVTLRSHTEMLTALREEQVEQRQRLGASKAAPRRSTARSTC